MNNNFFRTDLIGMQEELLSYAMRLTSDREEAKELLQETSFRALCREEIYEHESDTNFKSWVYTIMYNTFIDNCRRMAMERDMLGERENLTPHNLSHKQTNDVEQLHDKKEIHRIVKTLPEEYRIPFFLFVSGFKYHEIADKMGIPIGTVKSRIFYGREELQKLLGDFA